MEKTNNRLAWELYREGISFTDIASRLDVSSEEVQDAVKEVLADLPEVSDRDVKKQLELTLSEEITYLKKYRKDATNYTETDRLTRRSSDGEILGSSFTEREKKNFSAVASLSGMILNAVKLLAGMRGLLVPEATRDDLESVYRMLEDAPEPAEYNTSKTAISEKRPAVSQDISA